MTLTVLKHGGTWDFLATPFKIKAPTFEKLVTGFIDKLVPYLYDKFVDKLRKDMSMEELNGNNRRFTWHPQALYATDVTFQQTN
jgi:hypothetical protein